MMATREGLVTVAYQGRPGANGEAAVAAYWGGTARAVAARSFPALVAAVADGGVDFGVVPMWNSTIGPIREAVDALDGVADRVVRVGELTVPVRHALLALPGATLGAVRAVGSHRAALAQCRDFLGAHRAITPIVAWDTAGAAEELASMPDDRRDAGDAPAEPWYRMVPGATPESLAVIASPAVAGRFGLSVLADDIQDDPRNATRFAVVCTREATWRW